MRVIEVRRKGRKEKGSKWKEEGSKWKEERGVVGFAEEKHGYDRGRRKKRRKEKEEKKRRKKKKRSALKTQIQISERKKMIQAGENNEWIFNQVFVYILVFK